VVPVPVTTPTLYTEAGFWHDVIATERYNLEPALSATGMSQEEFVQTLYRAYVPATTYSLPTREYEYLPGCCRGAAGKKDFGSFDKFASLTEDPHKCAIVCDQTPGCTGYELAPTRWKGSTVFYICEVHVEEIDHSAQGFHCRDGKKSCFRAAACGSSETPEPCESSIRGLEFDFVAADSCIEGDIEASFTAILREGLDLDPELYQALQIFDKFTFINGTGENSKDRVVVLLNPAVPHVAYSALTTALTNAVRTARTFPEHCGIILEVR
jgi:hypothetical protein